MPQITKGKWGWKLDTFEDTWLDSIIFVESNEENKAKRLADEIETMLNEIDGEE